MVQVAKSKKYFELFLRLEPWHRQGEHQKFKSRSDFIQMRRFRARNCQNRFNPEYPQTPLR